ncbi:MAG: pyridoxal-phosphate dependent enzyme [Hyphomicrobiales bacterium]|nr:pyridoxal-phosphate dependent enzyme [Hyphomicrobiales bacterium]MCP5001815.1 pyridoxal-phosphate dependent enzyme [Hyphomicrobiales bacterium]
MKNIPMLDPRKPATLLEACPAYQSSPLDVVQLDGRNILVKDETARMRLGAFKALGGVYAVAQLIAGTMARPIAAEDFQSEPVRAAAGRMTFVCASAGNHGMAVAAGATLLGAKARIHLADTVPEDFARRLRAKGSEVVRSGASYEDSIAAAIRDGEETGAVHLADGSWPGYTEPPRLVMEGYTVLAEEMRRQFETEERWPSHVYLQAGVGGLAAAVAYMIRKNWATQPEIIIVEPEAAPCLKESVEAGQLVTVEGPVSNMGRLDCKVPSMLAFNILQQTADRFVTITDEAAADAVGVAHGLGYQSTPSGIAGLAALMADGERERPLVIVSEGAVADA